jgi:hypothetical protein
MEIFLKNICSLFVTFFFQLTFRRSSPSGNGQVLTGQHRWCRQRDHLHAVVQHEGRRQLLSSTPETKKDSSAFVLKHLTCARPVRQRRVKQHLVLRRLVLHHLVLNTVIARKILVKQRLVLQRLVLQHLVLQRLVLQCLLLQYFVLQRLVLLLLVQQHLVQLHLVLMLLVHLL